MEHPSLSFRAGDSRYSHPPLFQHHSWLWSVRRAHTLVCTRRWGEIEDYLHSLVYDLDTPVTKSMSPRTESSALTCPAFSLSQAQAEVGAHMTPQHLCRANIVVARGQRSCFVSPFALLQAHPAQWDRQETVEDSGPVIEIW